MQAADAQWFRAGQKYKSDFVFLPFLYHIWKLHVKCDSEQLFFLLIYQFNAIWQLLFAKKGLFFCSKNAHF